MIRRTFCLLVLITVIDISVIYSQPVDSTSFTSNSRLSFYSFENNAEILLHVPAKLHFSHITAVLRIGSDTLAVWKGIPSKKTIRIPFTLNLVPADYEVTTEIKSPLSAGKFITTCNLTILNYKSNEVKTDRLTGGLIVNKRPFFPFGFYCYSPVHPLLPEEEVVKGFNTISPYQKILPESFYERKAYMDRCAELGMKVHYNLLCVSGGGGVNSVIEGITDSEKKQLLEYEINAFKDHPALLAWYIADEPNGYGITPDSLATIYNLIKAMDPWHPVSIVFMAPFLSSRKYANSMDIVMADPYPVPDMPVTYTGNVAGTLVQEFSGKKPVWIVPQAFGGGELWSREPTRQEIRSMTYQSVIKGASGIQYFVRQGLNLFPKSAGTWAECGMMAVEIAELTPWLLSEEETIPVRSGSENVSVRSAVHDGHLLIIAVNKTNVPVRTDFAINSSISGRAKVLFENRNVTVSSGLFADHLASFGSQAYLINIKPKRDTLFRWKDNLIKDPGFEDVSSPGVPASCYARNGGDRGATYFLDSREHFEGNHSIRLVTPKENGTIRLRFFPVKVMAGRTYYISIRAKTDPEQGLIKDTASIHPRYFEISLGGYGNRKFELSPDWQEFVTSVTIPYPEEDLQPKLNVILQMPSAGTAWFDMLQLIEAVDINKSVDPALRKPWEDLIWSR
ncbi:MAG TPA: hypothetical protein PK719_05805 [Bacteroidales bacterium]|nr:hypothetical protein [Bacteroidales bacterium]